MEQCLSHNKLRINYLDNYRKESKPPIAGEPIITANVTISPKTTPTSMKRLFIPKISSSPVKNGLYGVKMWKNALKEKI